MAHQAKETEHAGAKHGRGAYWGIKGKAKKESAKKRRKNDKKLTILEREKDDSNEN